MRHCEVALSQERAQQQAGGASSAVLTTQAPPVRAADPPLPGLAPSGGPRVGARAVRRVRVALSRRGAQRRAGTWRELTEIGRHGSGKIAWPREVVRHCAPAEAVLRGGPAPRPLREPLLGPEMPAPGPRPIGLPPWHPPPELVRLTTDAMCCSRWMPIAVWKVQGGLRLACIAGQ